MRPLSHTIFIGRQLQHFNRLDSTNTCLHNLLSDRGSELPEGLTIVADEQYAGRGQVGAGWISEAGMNLTVSILLYPKFLLPVEIFYLNKAIALGVRDCVANFVTTQRVSIKWPNDIYCGHKKIAGILIENAFHSTSVQSSIVGIGLNVNQVDFDPEAQNPVSMKQISGNAFELQEVLEQLCIAIEQQYLILRGFDFKKIDDLYHEYLYGLNKETEFKAGDEIFSGKVAGVDGNGKLVVAMDGGIKKFGIKEIEWII